MDTSWSKRKITMLQIHVLPRIYFRRTVVTSFWIRRKPENTCCCDCYWCDAPSPSEVGGGSSPGRVGVFCVQSDWRDNSGQTRRFFAQSNGRFVAIQQVRSADAAAGWRLDLVAQFVNHVIEVTQCGVKFLAVLFFLNVIISCRLRSANVPIIMEYAQRQWLVSRWLMGSVGDFFCRLDFCGNPTRSWKMLVRLDFLRHRQKDTFKSNVVHRQ